MSTVNDEPPVDEFTWSYGYVSGDDNLANAGQCLRLMKAVKGQNLHDDELGSVKLLGIRDEPG
eukprot:604888-Pleurochrysis_carterae.AAC.1